MDKEIDGVEKGEEEKVWNIVKVIKLRRKVWCISEKSFAVESDLKAERFSKLDNELELTRVKVQQEEWMTDRG